MRRRSSIASSTPLKGRVSLSGRTSLSALASATKENIRRRKEDELAALIQTERQQQHAKFNEMVAKSDQGEHDPFAITKTLSRTPPPASLGATDNNKAPSDPSSSSSASSLSYQDKENTGDPNSNRTLAPTLRSASKTRIATPNPADTPKSPKRALTPRSGRKATPARTQGSDTPIPDPNSTMDQAEEEEQGEADVTVATTAIDTTAVTVLMDAAEGAEGAEEAEYRAQGQHQLLPDAPPSSPFLSRHVEEGSGMHVHQEAAGEAVGGEFAVAAEAAEAAEAAAPLLHVQASLAAAETQQQQQQQQALGQHAPAPFSNPNPPPNPDDRTTSRMQNPNLNPPQTSSASGLYGFCASSPVLAYPVAEVVDCDGGLGSEAGGGYYEAHAPNPHPNPRRDRRQERLSIEEVPNLHLLP